MCVVYLCHPIVTATTFYAAWWSDWRTEPPPCSYCSTSVWMIPGTVDPSL